MGEVVISARVARQLTGIYHKHGGDYQLTPSTAAARAAQYLPADYPGMLKFALFSLSVYLNLGWSSTQWLQNVLEAAHYGDSFRRCFFFDYKENRRPYPRVTNRGVQTSIEARPLSTRRRQRDV